MSSLMITRKRNSCQRSKNWFAPTIRMNRAVAPEAAGGRYMKRAAAQLALEVALEVAGGRYMKRAAGLLA